MVSLKIYVSFEKRIARIFASLESNYIEKPRKDPLLFKTRYVFETRTPDKNSM